jgi:hypothetical protein
MNQGKPGPGGALVAALCILGAAGSAAGAEVKPLLERIQKVGKEGKDNIEVTRAWRDLVRCGPDALLPILTALDEARPISANWLRSAVEVIVDRALAKSAKLPAAKLEAFVKDTKHAGPARRLAYECLLQVDKTAEKRLIPGMLNDPGAELRRDAVALVIDQADKALAGKQTPAALAAYRKALAAARDRDQVEHVAKRLKDLDSPVDLTARFGFITRWHLIGPFDNTSGIGFKKAYPPENKVDLAGVYQGKKDQDLRWIEHNTTQAYGMVDLNKALGKNMGAVAYAVAVVESAKERPVQIRAGSNNAVKLFLNGKQVYFRQEYHHGMAMDQHVGSGILKAGRNQVLIKVCQNEQTEEWAQLWSFQLRISDAIGGAVPVKVVVNKVNSQPKGKQLP